MPEHIWSVLCTRSIEDKGSNSVSLLDVLEAIHVQGPEPTGNDAIPLKGTLVSLWRRSDIETPEMFETRVVIIMPDGKETKATEVLKADMTEYRRYRSFMHISGIPFQGSGVYRFAVEFRPDSDQEWIRRAAVPLDVAFEKKVSPEKREPAAPKAKRRPRRR